ncbi:hypothetical protein DY000_02024560 [Brassica cretica]|uniref:Uncharacterized protein n=1 Tax=Brassica cretica TaxID=69181 RepID=A0ABQ7EL21_BRACR|nr:hypothetical protein DY000_02024560 [Brassica cretica]
MAQDDATFGAPGGEPTSTPEAAPPITADFMSSIMARLAHQDEVQKTTNDQLAALVVALTTPDGQTSRPQQIRRRLFNTNPTAAGGDLVSDDSEPNETLLADNPPVGSDLATIREIAELKLSFQQMSEKIHQATSTAPQIESVLAATSRTPFTSALTSVQLRKIEKLRLPEYKPGGDPVEHMTAFNIAMARARLLDEERGADNCKLGTTRKTLRKVAARGTLPPTKSNQLTAGALRTVDLTKHCKYHDVKGHNTTECKSLYAHYLSSLASGDFKFEPLKAKPKNVKSKNKERRAQRKATGKGRHSETQQRDDEEDAPRGNGEGDSSADEEQPANRRRIEVILSQQTLSSDDENDDTPVLEDLRDVLKRKFESEDSNSSTHNDLQTALDARKSQRISTSDPDPKERPNGDLRDKLNAGDSRTPQRPSRQHAPSDKNGRKDGYMYVVNENNVPVSTLVVRGEGWNKWDAPRGSGEGDSSADEEQPTNRRRIEVIFSQQTSSSDDENDNTPVLENLRDVLKRKFEFEDSNSFKHSDLRTALDAWKSRRISTSDPDPKERPNADLRDKLNAEVKQ